MQDIAEDSSEMGDAPSSTFLQRPVRAKRNRTISESERIMAGPSFKGIVAEFCRQKGHGFITPCDGAEKLFFHISDIEGELVPMAGDEVTYKLFPIPPKNLKHSAAHVNIVHLRDDTPHQKWDSRLPPTEIHHPH